jgi:hypothetical protein
VGVYARAVRLVIGLVALLAWACSDPPRRGAAPSATAEARTPDAAPGPRPVDAPVGDFTNVTGPVDGLWPGMAVEEARAFLTEAGVAFTETSRHAKRPHYIVTELDGWKATLYFDEAFAVVATILLQSPSVDVEAEAHAIVERTAARYGPPAARSHRADPDGAWSETLRAWRNDRVTLDINLRASRDRDGVRSWAVFAQWSRPR